MVRWDRFQVNDRAISCGQRYRSSPKPKRLEKSKPTVSPSIVVAKEAAETALSSSESCHQASESSESGCTELMSFAEVKSGETTNPSTLLFVSWAEAAGLATSASEGAATAGLTLNLPLTAVVNRWPSLHVGSKGLVSPVVAWPQLALDVCSLQLYPTRMDLR